MKNSMLKREYFEEEITRKIIKKEEESYLKTEDNSSIQTSYFRNRSTDPLTLPWTFGNSPLYFQSLNITSNWESFAPLPLMTSNEAFQKGLEEMTIKQESMIKLEPDSINQRHYFDKSISNKLSKAPNKVKKSVRASACKNYIGLVCSGFSRTILTAKSNSHVLKRMHELIDLKKNKYEETKNLSHQDLVKSIENHIYKTICGKRRKEHKKNRDFKIRTKTELSKLLVIKTEDCGFTCFKKEFLQEMMDYFFSSNAYVEWLSDGMMTPKNRGFLFANRFEIYCKFQKPIIYKPRFTHDTPEML